MYVWKFNFRQLALKIIVPSGLCVFFFCKEEDPLTSISTSPSISTCVPLFTSDRLLPHSNPKVKAPAELSVTKFCNFSFSDVMDKNLVIFSLGMDRVECANFVESHSWNGLVSSSGGCHFFEFFVCDLWLYWVLLIGLIL